MKKIIIPLLACLLLAQSSKRSIMTVYKDGTALVKQEIMWNNVPKGESILKYKDIPISIHKDTPFINFNKAQVLSQRFVDKTFSSDNFFKSKEGSLVNVKPKNEKIIRGQLLEISNKIITIQSKNGIRRFSKENIEYIESKDKINNPIFFPYLSWNIKANKAGRMKGDLVYKLSNITWNTIYRLIINGQVKGELVAEAVISNKSSKDFLNTNIQLVEGKLNNVKPSVTPRAPSNMSISRSSVPTMEEASLGDYHIYNAGNINKLVAKESITVRMYGPLNVDYEKIYVFENYERQQKEEPLKVELTLSNTEVHGLGIPLPAGKIDMYTFSGAGGIEYIGSDQMGQVPKGESSTIQAGYAFDITGKRKVLNYDRQRKSEEAVIEISISNTRTDPVQARIVEHINGDWVIKDQSHNYQKEDASTIHFSISLEPGKKEYITYTYRKEWK